MGSLPHPSRRTFSFGDLWLEPGAFTQQGPPIWLGGQGMHPPLGRRIMRYGAGLNPFARLTDDDLFRLAEGRRAAGRDLSELELVGGIRGTFRGVDDVADLDDVLASLRSSSPEASRPPASSR